MILGPHSYNVAPCELFFAHFKKVDINPRHIPVGKGNFNKGNSKGFVDWEIYRSSFLPSCAEYDEENKIGDFNAKTFNKVHEVQQQDALRRQLLKKKAKKAVKKAVMLTKMMSKSGGLLKAFGAQSPTKEPADDLSASTKMAFQSSSEVIKDSKKAAAGAAVQQ